MNNLEEVKLLFQLLFPEWKCVYASTNSFVLDHSITFIQFNGSVYFQAHWNSPKVLNKIRSKFFVLTTDLLPEYYALGELRDDILKGSN